ncbi:MAG: SDR family oxidoreductase [Alphaproteobacteria bacterium]|nr:SDR family oxidoreductase [Alphaproteobacteria bacterium]
MAEGTKAIAVTGSSRGIGAEIVRELARRGFTVGCLSRGGGLPDDIPTNATLLPFTCDVTDEDSVTAALAGFAQAAGGLNGLVNNAGVLKEHKSAELSVADYDNVMRTNATSVMMVSREAYPYLCAADGGAIVNIGSFWDKIGVPRNLPYCASKAAIAAITRCHAVEWARDGISVMNIAPGYIETDFNHDFFADKKTREWLRQRAPMQKPGTVGDVARLVAALFSEDIPFLTGDTIYLDGAQSVAL